MKSKLVGCWALAVVSDGGMRDYDGICTSISFGCVTRAGHGASSGFTQAGRSAQFCYRIRDAPDDYYNERASVPCKSRRKEISSKFTALTSYTASIHRDERMNKRSRNCSLKGTSKRKGFVCPRKANVTSIREGGEDVGLSTGGGQSYSSSNKLVWR